MLPLCVWMLASCAGSRVVIVRDGAAAAPPVASDTVQMRARGADSGKAPALVHQSVFGPLRSLFNSPGVARQLVGMRAEAYNITPADDVAESEWFEPPLRHPPDSSWIDVPDTSGPWVVVSTRVDPVPVITIRDGRDREYWLTFDAPASPELATATEVITARLYRAAGYHTPDVGVVTFDPLTQFASDTGVLHAALALVARDPDGRIRAAAHRVTGRRLGAFAFAGRRRDDPADSVPHEHRRELRGLYVVAAWLNHTDLFGGRTLDALVDSGGSTRVRHYLLGFDSGLAGCGVSVTARAGTEAAWDARKIAARFLSLGFYAAPWERNPAPPFDPAHWTPAVSNAAFSRVTVRDGFWGAKLVAALSETDIRTAVGVGRLSNSAAADSLVGALLSRRRGTMAYWFSKVTPLEQLVIEQGPAGPMLVFRDLAAAYGVVSPRGRRYAVRVAGPPGHPRVQQIVTLDLSDDGRGAVPLPGLPSSLEIARLRLEQRLGWIDVQALPDHAGRPRALRIYVLLDSAAGYRPVGRRY